MMKAIFIFILLGILASPYVLNAQEQQRSMYQNKLVKFTKMKHAGVGITIGGAILSAVGIGLVADGLYRADHYVDNSDESLAVTGEIVLGYCATGMGFVATSGGIVLWAIGSSKANSYRKKMRTFSLDLNPAPNQMLSLAYRF